MPGQGQGSGQGSALPRTTARLGFDPSVIATGVERNTWLDPRAASVVDPWYKRVTQTIGGLLGAGSGIEDDGTMRMRASGFAVPGMAAAKGPMRGLQRAARGRTPLEIIDPESRAYQINASGESAASLEAINRLKGMQGRGESFVAYDRAGQRRPLVGADAVDYRARAGETFGVEGPGGFRPLDDLGGRFPRTPAPAPVPTPAPASRAPGRTALSRVGASSSGDPEIDALIARLMGGG